MRRVRLILCALTFGIVIPPPSRAQTPNQSPPTAKQVQTSAQSHEIEVLGNQPWTDTGVDLLAGKTVTITATGKLSYMDGNAPGPEGLGRSWMDLLRALPVNSAGRGALIGRVGSDEAAQPFLVGAKLQTTVRAAGRLYLGINGPSGDSAGGNFHVTIVISSPEAMSPSANTTSSNNLANGQSAAGQPPSRTATVAPTATATAAAALPPDLLNQIPRRVADKDGNAGDMVNFLIVGSEDQLKAAFQAAGWVQVDKDAADAVVQALVASLSKQAYLTMPMSQLYLFGRPQDFGFAHAEPVTVVTTRHHLRLWKSALTVGNQPVWVGAATRDMGLERDQRNGKLTHHIDPNVDDEREFVNRSLTETGYVGQHTTVLPSDPVKDAKTATGGGFHSSGEVLFLWLNN
jgi:hypothetical protein